MTTNPIRYSFESAVADEEIRTFDVALQLLDPLYPEPRARLLRWLWARYNMDAQPFTVNRHKPGCLIEHNPDDSHCAVAQK